MKILYAPYGYVDVFFGDGWSNHTRLRHIKTKDGSKLFYVNGLQVSDSVMETIRKELRK